MKRFKNMLFVADTEGDNADAFERTVQLVKNNQAQLTVVSTMESAPAMLRPIVRNISLEKIENSLTDKFLLLMKNLVAPIQKSIGVNIKILKGKPFLRIIQEVLGSKIDLVIKTAEEGEIANRFFGSTDLEPLRKCPCPVLLLKSSKKGSFKKILAAVDFDPHEDNEIEKAFNNQILQMSTSLALSEGCELQIIHVWKAYGESSLRSGFAKQPENEVDIYVDEISAGHQNGLEMLIAEFGGVPGKEAIDYLKPKIHLVKGVAKTVIPDVVEENQIDLVIMGTVGRTGIPGFIMGNTAEAILNQIDCSVFTMKPNGFVTPITL
jgi:universal stress protein E